MPEDLLFFILKTILQSLIIGGLARSCKEIYPPEIEHKKENTDYCEKPFFNLGIKILDKNLILRLKKWFFISVLGMPHLTSKIPSKIFYYLDILQNI